MTSRPARARTPGWFISWTALLFGLGFSVAANVAAAHPQLGPRLLASGAPVLALFAAGIIERVSLTGTHWIQRAAIVGGLLIVVAFAFITSYQHQQLLALEYGNKPLSADLYPIAVDALVLMSSVALAVIGHQRRAAQAAGVASQVAAEPAPPRPGEAMTLAEVTAPREVAEAAAFPATLPQVIHPRPVADTAADLPGDEGSNGGRKATPALADRVRATTAALAAVGVPPRPALVARIVGVENSPHVARTVRSATKEDTSAVTHPTTPPPPPRPDRASRKERSADDRDQHARTAPSPGGSEGDARQQAPGTEVDEGAGGPADSGSAVPREDG